MKVLTEDIVLTLKGHRIYSSVSPAALGLWSEGEFGTPTDNPCDSLITCL